MRGCDRARAPRRCRDLVKAATQTVAPSHGCLQRGRRHMGTRYSGRGMVGVSDAGVGVGEPTVGRAVVGGRSTRWRRCVRCSRGPGPGRQASSTRAPAPGCRVNDSGDGVLASAERGVVGIDDAYRRLRQEPRQRRGGRRERRMRAVFCLLPWRIDAGCPPPTPPSGNRRVAGSVTVTGDLVLAGAMSPSAFDWRRPAKVAAGTVASSTTKVASSRRPRLRPQGRRHRVRCR